MAKYVILNPIVTGSYQNCADANGYVELYVNNTKWTHYTGSYTGTGTVYGIRVLPSVAAIIEPPVSLRAYHYYILIIADREYDVTAYAYYNDETYGTGGGGQTTEMTISGKVYRAGSIGAQFLANESTVIRSTTGLFAELNETVDSENELDNLLNTLGIRPLSGMYPITYHYTNSTVSGPSEAAVGDTVTVSAIPDVGYGIIDATTQILVTNDDVAVPYTWDAINQRITFTMPQPAENRGGFGSTGQ